MGFHEMAPSKIDLTATPLFKFASGLRATRVGQGT
jgi:hypothetical protein